MKLMKKLILAAAVLILTPASAQPAAQIYAPEWASLAKHNPAPEWYRDAKFGIYFHWGVYSVCEFHNEWYPRLMYMPHHDVCAHHQEKFGKEFEYHDFVPMFTGEQFDAAEWTRLFKDAGARFIGPVAEHHDGFAMWDSDCTPWNAKDMGPHRDIVGEMEKAVRKEGLKFITTFHHARNLQRYSSPDSVAAQEKVTPENRKFRNSHFPYIRGKAPASDDPELQLLYGNLPEKEWLDRMWLGKLREVIDKYHPDIIWFDAFLDQIPERYRQLFCAYYLNHAAARNQEVVIIRKQDDLPISFSVLNLEKTRKDVLSQVCWETDETISTGSWSYTPKLKIRPAKELIHILMDIVSKNGTLLLNVSPQFNGCIPQDQRETLLGMGVWLRQNGAAVYGTRPWFTFGEGPTRVSPGAELDRKQVKNLRYVKEDIRYTTKPGKIYATLMGEVASGDVFTLTAFAEAFLDSDLEVRSVKALATGERLKWKVTPGGLQVTTGNPSNSIAEVLEISID